MDVTGPVVIGYDGSDAAEHAIREAGKLLSGHRALVVTVWKQGIGFETMELPATIAMPAATLDVRTALEVDRELAERSERVARKGADIARRAGFEDPEGLAVADDPDVAVAATIIRVAREVDAQGIVTGAHNEGVLSEVLLGSTSRDVIRHADRPVVVIRET
jgi:nucleotide-binding universal stress UspA family protein